MIPILKDEGAAVRDADNLRIHGEGATVQGTAAYHYLLPLAYRW